MLTCKIILPDSPHPIIISTNLGFWALYFAWWNKFHFFRLITTKNIFFIFGCWLLPEKFSFCLKNNGFARVRGLQPPVSYAYVWMDTTMYYDCKQRTYHPSWDASDHWPPKQKDKYSLVLPLDRTALNNLTLCTWQANYIYNDYCLFIQEVVLFVTKWSLTY